MKTYTVIVDKTEQNLTKREIVNKLNFTESLKNVVSLEINLNGDKLFVEKRNGNVVCYSNVYGSWGFPICIA